MNQELVITADAIYDGVDYKPRPGLTYEIADGIHVKTKRHTVDRLERLEAIAKEASPKIKAGDLHPLEMVLEQARELVDVPQGFTWDRTTVDSTVAQRMVDDAFTTAYLTSRMPKAFLDRLSQAAENEIQEAAPTAAPAAASETPSAASTTTPAAAQG